MHSGIHCNPSTNKAWNTVMGSHKPPSVMVNPEAFFLSISVVQFALYQEMEWAAFFWGNWLSSSSEIVFCVIGGRYTAQSAGTGNYCTDGRGRVSKAQHRADITDVKEVIECGLCTNEGQKVLFLITFILMIFHLSLTPLHMLFLSPHVVTTLNKNAICNNLKYFTEVQFIEGNQ